MPHPGEKRLADSNFFLGLAQRIERKTKLSEEETVRLGVQLLDALHAAHERGVIHRDLKPDNVFVVPTGRRGDRVKILDFGISSKLDEGAAKLTYIKQFVVMVVDAAGQAKPDVLMKALPVQVRLLVPLLELGQRRQLGQPVAPALLGRRHHDRLRVCSRSMPLSWP